MKAKKIVIIGAGITGLVAADRLLQKGYRVTIFEKNDVVGGLTGGFKIGQTSIEKAYHHIFKTDNYAIKLIEELGLIKKLKWYPENVAIYWQNKIYPFVSLIDLLKFKPLNIIDKLRLGIVSIYLQKDNDWRKFANIAAEKWLKIYYGQKIYDVMWAPLLRGKFHQYANKISMAWMWARIHTRVNSGKLGYLEGGFNLMASELAKRIQENGGTIKLNSEVDIEKIKKNFDVVLYTGANKKIKYLGFVNLVFTSSQSLSKYYWHNINDPKSPFLALIQQTNLVGKENYSGKEVYYLGVYLPEDHKYFLAKDNEIEKDFFDYLKIIFPNFDKELVEDKWVFKFKKAQHVVNTNYQIPNYKIQENIYQANFTQIYPEDRGINFAVREGEKVAELISQQEKKYIGEN